MKTKCCHTSHYHVVDDRHLCINDKCNQYLTITQCELEFTKARNAFAISVFVLCSLFSFDDFSKADKSFDADLTISFLPGQLPISIQNIEEELKKQDVICYKEVLAQIKIESGHLSSFLLKRTNNMLGMRYPVKRSTTACGIYLPQQDTIILGTTADLKKYAGLNNYAVYETWQDAIADYKLWQETYFKVNEKYLDFLGRVYAEDSMYVSKIKYLAKRAN